LKGKGQYGKSAIFLPATADVSWLNSLQENILEKQGTEKVNFFEIP